MSPITPIDSPDLAGRASRTERQDATSARQSQGASVKPEATDRDAVLASLQATGDKIVYDGRAAEFSYDEELDLVVVKIYSSGTEPREIVRQIPPEKYVAFASRYREMLGVLFDELV